MLHPLRTPSFRLLFIGRTLSLLGDSVIPTALPLAIYLTTGSTASLAIVLACAMVPKLLLLPLGGVVGDRFNARTVAFFTDVVRGAAQLFVGSQLIEGSPDVWQIAVAEAIGGAAGAFARPTGSPLIKGTVEPVALLRANSLMSVANSAIRLCGPAVGGSLVLTVGPGWAFILDGLSFVASASLLVAIKVRHIPIVRRSVLADLQEGWQEVRSRDWYWTSLIAHGIWNGATAVLMTLGPALMIRDMGGKETWIAMLQVGAIGLLLGSLFASRARLRRPVLAANLGLATYALPLGLLAAHASAMVLVVSYGIAQVGLGFLGPVWDTAVQSAVPEHALARVTSYDWLISLAAMPLGYLLAPLAASAWGGETLPLAITAGAVAFSCLATAAIPGVRNFTQSVGELKTKSQVVSDVPKQS
ncbi:MFS transporter [Streptomyces sp. NPDC092903]|uniref:MFS transporter n=1 Tax=Streptomyces sp. NPDC092903 TaxID=3366017 RepID=UPI0038233EF2